MPRNISPAGFQALREEQDKLLRQARPQLLRDIAAAAAQGDRSENAEYIYGKKKLREIDRRLRELSKKMSDSLVVDPLSLDQNSIRFGAEVELQPSSGDPVRYQLVGPDEIDPKRGKISSRSPLGSALLGKRSGDEITIQTPRGPKQFRVLSFRYQGTP